MPPPTARDSNPSITATADGPAGLDGAAEQGAAARVDRLTVLRDRDVSG